MDIKNNYCLVVVFLTVALVIGSAFASASITQSTNKIDERNPMISSFLDWTELNLYGQDWDIDADGPSNPPVGDVKDFGEHSIRMGNELFGTDATAWYMFDIGEDIVDEGGLQVGIYFCDLAIIPGFGGPDLSIYDWEDDSWTTWGNIGDQDDYIWIWKAPTNSNKYVLNGLVWVKIYAESLDDTILDSIGVKYMPGPDLECNGNLKWVKVKPGSTVTGTFTAQNIGGPGTTLEWQITEWPEWGTWNFNPSSGELTPGEGAFTIQISVIVPNEPKTEFTGELKVVNEYCSNDYEIIPISLSTPQNANLNSKSIPIPLENFQRNGQILQLIIKAFNQHSNI